MEVFYFGKGPRPLFGTRFEPRSSPKRTSILICPSWGIEYMRSYRGLYLLARQCAEHGFETMRFDYSCTGDSGGESGSATTDAWIEDIGVAANELLALSGNDQLCIVGLRLGSLLAQRAVELGVRANALVLWDVPSSGQHWVDQLRQQEKHHYARKNRYRGDRDRVYATERELIGMPFPEPLSQGIVSLSAASLPSKPRIAEWVSADQPRSLPSSTEHLSLPDLAYWQDAHWLTTPWTPSQSIRSATDFCARWLP